MPSIARRTAGLFPLLLAGLLLAGCPEKEAPAPAGKEAPATAKATPAAAKKAPASVKAAPAPAKAAPAPKAPPARRMSRSELQPTVPAPAWKVVHQLARGALGARVVPYAGLKPLGGTRFVTVLGVPGAEKGLPLLKLALLDRGGEGWKILLHDIYDYAREPADFDAECSQARKVLVSLYVSDYDWDDAPEVKVRHRFKGCDFEEGEGDPEKASPATHLQIYNAGPPITEALSAFAFQGKGAGHHSGRNTKITHGQDLNGDGHPDLTIKLHEQDFLCNLGETIHDRRTWVYHWDHRSDSFKLVKEDQETETTGGYGADEQEEDVE